MRETVKGGCVLIRQPVGNDHLTTIKWEETTVQSFLKDDNSTRNIDEVIRGGII